MAFTVKTGDLVYAADDTLGFVADVYRLGASGKTDEGWFRVQVTGRDESVYIAAKEVGARDEAVPSVLLRITMAQATDAAHRRVPDAVRDGTARPEQVDALDIGRPESPALEPDPNAVRDWPQGEPRVP
ncbi:MAG TPA: hypothetical protein VID73_03085 [Ktedonobacterales bacterium]|jgi:hypothetical protein